jgi:hypothetical protein
MMWSSEFCIRALRAFAVGMDLQSSIESGDFSNGRMGKYVPDLLCPDVPACPTLGVHNATETCLRCRALDISPYCLYYVVGLVHNTVTSAYASMPLLGSDRE